MNSPNRSPATEEMTAHGADVCIQTCLGMGPGERLVVLGDRDHEDEVQQLLSSAGARGVVAQSIRLADRSVGLNEVPDEVEAAMRSADAVIVALEPEDGCQFWHTSARVSASAAGARIGLLFPPTTWDISASDLRDVQRDTDYLARRLEVARSARLTGSGGTDLTMSLDGRRGWSCHSLINGRGDTATIPQWGDAEVSPLEGTATGTLVVDVSMTYLGILTEPVRMTVQAGEVVDIAGGVQAQELSRLLDAAGAGSRNIAELGFGMVRGLTPTGHKDDTLYGTAHVALGHNASLGGTVEAGVHLDAVLWAPTLTLDDVLLLSNGEFTNEPTDREEGR